jgi:hypothetical protein
VRRGVVGFVVAAAIIGVMRFWMDGSEYEAAARDAIRSDETVQRQIGEVVTLEKPLLGRNQFDFLGSQWSAEYEFRATGTHGTADVSIALEGTDARWTSYRGTLTAQDGRVFAISGTN